MRQITFLGNCQADALYRGSQSLVCDSEIASKRFLIFSHDVTVSYGIHEAKAFLLRFLSPREYAHCISNGFISTNPSLEDMRQTSDDVFVLTLFHEKPYYRHKRHGFCVSVSWKEIDFVKNYKEMFKHFTENFDKVEPDAFSYLTRYKALLDRVIAEGLSGKYVLFKRVSSALIEGKNTSWLEGWPSFESEALEILSKEVKRADAEIVIFDADTYVSTLLESGEEVGSLFSRYLDLQTQPESFTIDVSLDIEHLSPAVFRSIAADILTDSDWSIKERQPIKDSAESAYYRDIDAFVGALSARNEQLALASLEKLLSHSFNYKYVLAALARFGKGAWGETMIRLVREIEDSTDSRIAAGSRQAATALALAGADNPLVGKSRSRRIALWGAGGRARYIIEQTNLLDDFEILFVLDKAEDKHGSLFCGKPVMAPRYVTNEDVGNVDFILVASTFYYEILASVEGNAVFKEVVFEGSDDLLLWHFLKEGQFTMNL